MFGVCCPITHLKHIVIHEFSSQSSRRSPSDFFLILLQTATDNTHYAFADWNQEYPCAIPLEGRSGYLAEPLLSQATSRTPASTPAVSTPRSITPREGTTSTLRMTSPPQSQPTRTSTDRCTWWNAAVRGGRTGGGMEGSSWMRRHESKHIERYRLD